MSIDAQPSHGEKVRRTLMSIDSGLTVVRGPVPRRCQGLRGTGPRATGCWHFFVPFEIWRSRTTETRGHSICRARSPDLDRAQTTETRRYPVGALSEPVDALWKRADYVLCSGSGDPELQRRADNPSVGQDRLILTRTTETCRSTGDALPEPGDALWKRANAP